MQAATTRICLALTEKSLAEDLALIEGNRRHIDLVELRADFLDPGELARVASFPARAGLPVILTIRRRSEGGHFVGSESERIALLEGAIGGGWAFVDLEEDLLAPALDAAAERSGVRVIRSFHDYSGVPQGLVARTRRLARNPSELPKAAVMPRSTRDLLALLGACSELAGLEKIILGMGEWGFPTRILSGRLGSYLTYCTAGKVQAAPGHVDPLALDELYRVRSLTAATRLFCVIGNPVMHSRSPLIHNSGYRAAGLDACYLPIQIDDPALFLPVADRLGVEGASVTIPHKESIIPLLAERDPFVDRIGSCNTMVRLALAPGDARAAPFARGAARARWRGENTDASGFLAPLLAAVGGGKAAERRGGEGHPPRSPLAGLRALVIGAGGASRAVVAALVEAGCAVAILNRTLDRAQRLAAEFGCCAEPLSSAGVERAASAVGAGAAGHPASLPFDLIVQTTSAGMRPHEDEDPLPFYEFRGGEIVYELVYAPRETVLLARAAHAGCRTIGGFEMLLAQAYLQFKLFTGVEFPEDAKRRLAG